MSIGGHAWRLRRRVLGPERVVTGDAVTALARGGTLTRRGRARVRALWLRELAFGPPRRGRIRVGRVRVELGDDGSFPVDWRAFVEVVAEQAYSTDYANALVLDVGAHKGYFGAYAIAGGAARVLSIEPEERNAAALARAAAAASGRWQVRRAAVSSEAGTGTLRVAATSWAHSLMPLADAVGEQQVELLTLGQALAELGTDAGRTVVKIDAEGSECEILADPADLAGVDELLVEWHAETASCTSEELARRIAAAGLAGIPARSGPSRFVRAAA